jgi:hypothetical protein
MVAPASGSAGNAIRLVSTAPLFRNTDTVNHKRFLFMKNGNDRRQIICNRLQELGYAREKHIKLYGEEFHLVSNPVPDGDGFAVDGITRMSGSVRRVRIPLSLVYTVEKEFALGK